MVNVRISANLHAFFPVLEGKDVEVEATTIKEVVEALERAAPGIAFYLCDERGRLRRHVNVFVENSHIDDRQALSDAVTADANVFIAQALSGG